MTTTNLGAGTTTSGAALWAAPEAGGLTIERYSHSTDPTKTGMRGTRVSAETRFQSGRVFSTEFPTVYVTDNGEVECGDLLVPAADFLAWARAVVDHVDARMDAL